MMEPIDFHIDVAKLAGSMIGEAWDTKRRGKQVRALNFAQLLECLLCEDVAFQDDQSIRDSPVAVRNMLDRVFKVAGGKQVEMRCSSGAAIRLALADTYEENVRHLSSGERAVLAMLSAGGLDDNHKYAMYQSISHLADEVLDKMSHKPRPEAELVD